MPLRQCSLIALGLASLSLGTMARAQTVASAQSAVLGRESLALRELREQTETVPAAPGPGTFAQAAATAEVSLDGTGLDADFAARIRMPSVRVRITPRLAHTLGVLRTDTRMRRIVSSWIRHAGRYRARIERALLTAGVPTAILWLSAAESGFDPRAESHAGAVGLWQFMPDTARSYGLRVDTWVDERRDPARATEGAIRFLTELHERFGTWELAFAAYNMGYNGVLRAVRKYNTNDFELLASLEAGLPFETIEYVPRIISVAIAAQNTEVFGFPTSDVDPTVAWSDVTLDRSVSLSDLAREANIPLERLRELNPGLLRSRTPPVTESPFVLHVPSESAAAVRDALTRLETSPTRAWVVRHGEDLAEIAQRFGLRRSQLLSLSGLTDDRSVRPGTTLLVPDRDPAQLPGDVTPVVPVDPALRDLPVAQGRQRVWLRITDTSDLSAVARALQVSRTDLVRWNGLDPSARLLPGMWLQAHINPNETLSARVWPDDSVELLDRNSELFNDRAAAASGLVRVRFTVSHGDTLESLASRYGITPGRLARINRRSRRATLTEGESIVVYCTPENAQRSTASP